MVSMARRALPLICVLLLLTAALSGCPSPPSAAGEPATVTVAVTRDFGKELVLAGEVEIGEGTDAMTALKSVAGVEKATAGGKAATWTGFTILTEYP